jgi:uncharacterized repeat protein (TIGR02543 family)
MSSATTWNIVSNATLYASWTIINYTITYTLNGGTNNGSNPSTYNIESATITFAAPTRTGYTFAGWSVTSIPAGSTGNKSTTASWTANSFLITLNANGGTTASNSAISVTYATSIEAFNIDMRPTRTGYTFNGYYTATSGGTQRISSTAYVALTSTTYTAAVTLYAQWTAITYTITFSPATGNLATNAFATYDLAMSTSGFYDDDGATAFVPTMTAPSQTGYSFQGYFSGTGGTGAQYYTSSMTSARTWDIAANSTLYGYFSGNPYTVTFNSNGGTTASPPTKGVVYGSAYGTLATTSRTGYIFDGWYTASSGGSLITTGSIYSVLGNQTLWAQWTPITYTIAYNGNSNTGGSTASSSHTYDVAKALTVNGYTRTGYYFNAWNSLANGTGTSYTNVQSVTNLSSTNGATVTLYAQWIGNSFNITLNANGGSTASNSLISVVYATSIEAWNSDMNPTRTGYTFNGYYTATSGGTQRISPTGYVALTSTTYTSPATLYAQWTANPYTVTLNANGGSGGTTSVTATYDANMPSAVAPSRTGYIFNGYYTATSGGTQYYTSSMTSARTWNIAANTTLYAQWSPITYNVAFNANGGSGTMSTLTNINYGSPFILGNSFTRTGHTFVNWNTLANGTGTSYSSTNFVANLTTTNGATVTLYAQWTPITYTIAYNGNGSTSGSTASSSHTYNVAKALTANGFSRTGHTFAGWATSSGGAVAYFNGQSVVNLSSAQGTTVTLWAKWTANQYTVTFNANGGGTPSPTSKTVIYGLTYGALATVTRSGFTFNGWYTASSGGTQILSTTTVTITASQTLFAQWTAVAPSGLTYLGTIGAQNNSTWTFRSFAVTSGYKGHLVLRYTRGSSFTGDVQVDDFNVGGTIYNPEVGVYTFQTSTVSTTTYTSVNWSALATGTTGLRWNRDASGTPSGSTGNTTGFTGSFYYYAETSSGSTGSLFWLRSPETNLSTSTVSFYSAQNGATCGPIDVYFDYTGAVQQQTARPDIIDYGCYSDGFSNYATWRVQNLDASTATIYTEASDSTPDINAGSIASNSTTSFRTSGALASNLSSVTVYATAQASGKTLSTVESQTVSLSFCVIEN